MRSKPTFFGLALWIEALALGTLALVTKSFWLLPPAGCVALLASLYTGLLPLGTSLCLLATGGWLWTYGPASPLQTAHPIATLLLGAALSFLHILAGLQPVAASPMKLCLRRLSIFLHFSSAGVLLASIYTEGHWHHWLAVLFALLNMLMVLDCLARLAGRAYTPKRHWDALPTPGAFFFYRWLGTDWQACHPAPAKTTETVDLKLAEMWMWPSLRTALPGLVATTTLLLWLMSCLHQLPAGVSGVRHQLGKWDPVALTPGLQVSLPWPLGGVHQVDTRLLREVVLGFRADPGQPILWEKAHYEDEQKSLVGGGDDFLSISVPVFYRISDPVQYLRAANHSESLLRDLAERLLLRLTLHLPARNIMTTAREHLRTELHRNLQAELDAHRSGLTIAEVYFRDIHPPVAVALNFQEVVSALEEKEAFVHEGESYQRDIRTRSQGDASAILITATASADSRRQQVQGQASRYTSMLGAWALAPELYQWREGYRVFDDSLSGAKKAVFDDAVQGSIPAHLDLRKVLNPDFVDTVPPRSHGLVPKPSISQDAFDLDIEGYLRSGQGEVPAPATEPTDPDNLLKNQPATP